MGEIIFVADTRYRNKCAKCGKEIPAHSACFWEKGTKNNWHEGCYANPITPQQAGRQKGSTLGQASGRGEPTRTDPSSIAPAEADAYVLEGLQSCIKIYNNQFPNLPMEKGAPIIAELLRTWHGFSTGRRIAESDERKIKAYGKG